MIEEEKEKGEWKDLIIQNLLLIGLQVLVIGELVVKSQEEELVLLRAHKHQVGEEAVPLIPLKKFHHR